MAERVPRMNPWAAHLPGSTGDFPRPSQHPQPIALRRLQRDWKSLLEEPLPGIHAAPSEQNILEWHYCIEGSLDTPYHGGYYHGKVVFQPDFPWKPPSICMTTPNGRFRINMRLCLSISDYHPEQWNPGWTVSSILLGLHSFMNEDGVAAGAIVESNEVRRELAQKSKAFNLANPDFCRMFPALAESFRAAACLEASSLSVDNSRSQLRKRESNSDIVVDEDAPQAKRPVDVIDLTDD